MQRSNNWGHCRLEYTAEIKIVLLSFEWTSKAAAVSLRAASTSCHPLRLSYLFYRVSYGSLHVWISSHLVSAELLSLRIVYAKLDSQHICKPLPASNPHTAPGKPPSPSSIETCKSLFKLLTFRPFLGALLLGVEGGESICSLLLDNWWAQKNWNILKKKQGEKKSMWRNWIIDSCSRNAWLVATVRSPSSGTPGCELKPQSQFWLFFF